jgi:hypothetical protein
MMNLSPIFSVIQSCTAGMILSGRSDFRKISFWKIVSLDYHGSGYLYWWALGESKMGLNSSDFSRKNSSIPFILGIIVDIL